MFSNLRLKPILYISVAFSLAIVVLVYQTSKRDDSLAFSEYLLAAIANPENRAKAGEIINSSDEIIVLNKKLKTQTGTERTATIQVMKQKAQDRKVKLLKLMENDPGAALQTIKLKSLAGQVPLEVKDDVEKSVTVDSVLTVLHVDDFEKKEGKFVYFLQSQSGNTQKVLRPIANISRFKPGSMVQVQGYELENTILSSASGPSFKVLSVPSISSSDTKGVQRIGVFLINFQDSAPKTATKEQVESGFDAIIDAYFRETSYNQISFSAKVFDWYTLPRSKVDLGSCQWPAFDFGKQNFDESELSRIFSNNKVRIADFDRVLFITDNRGCDVGPVGFAFLGKIHIYDENNIDHHVSFAWDGSLDFGKYVAIHEIGHGLGLGLYHANSWICKLGARVSIYNQDCKHNEYGNIFDVMGASSLGGYFNAYFRETLQWLDSTSIQTISQSGRYNIKPLETTSGVRAAKIQTKNGENPFYLEYRQNFVFGDEEKQFTEGVIDSSKKGLIINWLDSPSTLRMLFIGSPKRTFSLTLNTDDPPFRDDRRLVQIGPVVNADKNGITFDVLFESADLELSGLTINPSSAVAGQHVIISAKVTNKGSGNISGAKFQMDPGQSPQSIALIHPIGECGPAINLSSGTSCLIAYDVVYPIPTLVNTATFTVDPDNFVFDVNRNNNQLKKTFVISSNVVSPPPCSPPDSASFITQEGVPAQLTAGQQFTITIKTKNAGCNTWSASGDNPTRLGSQSPQDNTLWGTGRIAATADVASGEIGIFTATLTAPKTAGTYDFNWRMVHDGVRWFGDSTPNVQVKVVPAPVQLLSGLPDLAISSITLNPAVPVQNSPVTVKATISNIGNASGAINLLFDPGITGSFPNTGVSSDNTCVDGGKLEPGASCSLAITVTYTDTASHTIIVDINDGLKTLEKDNTNNKATKTFVVSPGAPSPVSCSSPDVASFVSQDGVPAQLTVGQQFTVTIKMKNTGCNTWAPSGLNPIRLGAQAPERDSTIWGTHRIAGTADISPGNTGVFTTTLTAPQTAGTYSFQWQMVHDGVRWFGDFTPLSWIKVSAP